MTSDYINVDMIEFSGPKNKRKYLGLGDLEKKNQDGGSGHLEKRSEAPFSRTFSNRHRSSFISLLTQLLKSIENHS